jgi:hypothetical protein
MALWIASEKPEISLGGLTQWEYRDRRDGNFARKRSYGPEKCNFQYQGAGADHAQSGKPYAYDVSRPVKRAARNRQVDRRSCRYLRLR